MKNNFSILYTYNKKLYHTVDSTRFSFWLVNSGYKWCIAFLFLTILYPVNAMASNYTYTMAFQAFLKWVPLLVKSGFVLNVIISFFAMMIGTALGVILGLAQVSQYKIVRIFASSVTQLFRNIPWLVLLFIIMLTFPFEIETDDKIYKIPDWTKAVFGFSLPIMANISEIVRGAIKSVPLGQWEAAESLAFSRQKTFWQIILPQCYKRMIPPWMNWYAILSMATPLVSLLGVEEIITLSRQAMEAENNNPELLIPFYSFALLIFFAYCYPIAKFTIALEKRYAVKL
tara:strand:+ start:2777 stop:3634 length:858 start_codon:yes stop_codon:yes gene_type:complete